MEKRWIIDKPTSDEFNEIKSKILEVFKCPELIADILIKKGLTDIDEIENFFESSLGGMHDPFLFKDMDKAANRVVEAIKKGEHITIYGDYDVDGTTSTALLYLGLRKVNGFVDFYIPHRMVEGYGLSLNGIEQLKDQGTDLIISVDCGINAVEEVEAVNATDMDIIITDHHTPKELLPNAYAIINPKMKDSGYPFQDLAGVGVAFKLLLAVYQKLGMGTDPYKLRYLDLVAVGTIADIVPLKGENRIFASLGLQRLIQKKNKGLKSLVELSGLSSKELNTSDIIFGLAPRINAAGRMGSAMRAVELMVCENSRDGDELAEIIERENSIRQQIDQKTFMEANEIIEKKYKNFDETFVIVVSSDNWHPGVIGIVASKLVEKYYRPTIMVSFSGGVGIASGRSIAGVDLFEAISQFEPMLESFGGHKYAAGLTILPEYLDAFETKLNNYFKTHIPNEQLVPPLSIDKHIELYDINDNLLDWLDKFAPFGPGNMRPIFYTKDVTIVNYPYTVGRNHLKLKVMKDGCELDLIGFNLGDFLPFIKKNSKIDIAYSLEVNVWQNKSTIQGKLKDIHLHKLNK